MDRTNVLVIICLAVVVLLFTLHPQTLEEFNPLKASPQDRRILVIYTGGTIGMKHTSAGYKPVKGYFEKQLREILNLHADISGKLSPYDVIEYDPLIDSSNMTPKEWNKMIRTVQKHYDAYDGFIIVHGTDTMAYSASALSFALKGLEKPVVQFHSSYEKWPSVSSMLAGIKW